MSYILESVLSKQIMNVESRVDETDGVVEYTFSSLSIYAEQVMFRGTPRAYEEDYVLGCV